MHWKPDKDNPIDNKKIIRCKYSLPEASYNNKITQISEWVNQT